MSEYYLVLHNCPFHILVSKFYFIITVIHSYVLSWLTTTIMKINIIGRISSKKCYVFIWLRIYYYFRRGQNDATLLTIKTWQRGQLLDIKIQSEKGVRDVIKLQVGWLRRSNSYSKIMAKLLSQKIKKQFSTSCHHS